MAARTDSPLLIYHHLPKSGGTSLLGLVRGNYGEGEVAQVYGEVDRAYRDSLAAGTELDLVEWYRGWYESLPDEGRRSIRCVAGHDANRLMPTLDRPFRAFCMLRDPVERVWSLYHFLLAMGRAERHAGRGTEIGRELLRREWTLADLYRELGGGDPRGKPDELFSGFFNAQARNVLAPWRDESKLGYWTGAPPRGYDLRDEALGVLTRHYVVGVHEQYERSVEHFATAFGWDRLSVPRLNESAARGRPDSRTRSLILAHNQIDAELHAHFAAALERSGPRRDGRRASHGAAVCVLGMSRSGTSVTARILNLLGVDLGPERELMPAAGGNNPAGFWEHEAIADLDEDILATLGDAPRQRWRHPPPLEPGWEADPRLEPHRRRARSIVQQSFGSSPLWGWKDPRTCLTLPFWQELLPRMRHVESRLRYVLCVRHPLDVAASLQARDGVEQDEALRLWLRYTTSAIVHTSGSPRLFVSYERYFEDWQLQTRRLAQFLGFATLTDAQRTTLAEHLDERLWHHREGTGRGPDAEVELPSEVEDLYVRLTELTDPETSAAPTAEAELDATARRAAASTK